MAHEQSENSQNERVCSHQRAGALQLEPLDVEREVVEVSNHRGRAE
jgi:hypothetical protein